MTDAADLKRYNVIVGAIIAGVKALQREGAPANLITMALMDVAVRIAVAGYGREDAAHRLRGQLDELLKAEGADETTH
jgi:hypothetical protein